MFARSRFLSRFIRRPPRPYFQPSRTSFPRSFHAHSPLHRPQYRRFDGASTTSTRFRIPYILLRWARHPNFYRHLGIIGLGTGSFYVYNLDTVPVTNRRRFNCITPNIEQKLGEQTNQAVLQEFRGKILPPSDRRHVLVTRVLNRLVEAADLPGQKWEVRVIDDSDQINAFVLPGGKVFVFTGILPLCKGEDGLAAVLGHEIAHNIGHHTAEQLSRSVWLFPIIIMVDWFIGGGGVGRLTSNLLFELPGSRRQETEADYIGLLLMAKACFDPRKAVDFWDRMQRQEKVSPPAFLSTHPNSKNRLKMIEDWLPEANDRLASSECGTTSFMANAFFGR